MSFASFVFHSGNTYSLTVFTLPGMTVRCTVPFCLYPTSSSQRASTITFPSSAITPHRQALSSKTHNKRPQEEESFCIWEGTMIRSPVLSPISCPYGTEGHLLSPPSLFRLFASSFLLFGRSVSSAAARLPLAASLQPSKSCSPGWEG